MSHSFFSLNLFLGAPRVPGLELLPDEMKIAVQDITSQPTQRDALLRAYTLLGEKYHGSRMLTFLRPDRWFLADTETLWSIRGFLHCHHINYLLRTLLLASGQFQPENIEARWTRIWFVSPHQYLVVTLRSGQKIEIDLWAKVYGIPFGTHAHGFQSGDIFAKIG